MPENVNPLTSYTKKTGIPNIQQGNVISPNEDVVYTRKSIGYADGYSEFDRKSGGLQQNGSRIIERVVQSTDSKEHEKYVSPELLLDNQSNKFRRINGYGPKATASDYYEDPTYLIFDLKIRKDESPLFRNDVIKAFLDEYINGNYVPELVERKGYWEEFVDRLFRIFPSDNSSDGSGMKRHYIEAVGGLDVLLNPIINYPEDVLTFSITEDVTMSLQYLAELYNNLIYSYDTHRYLIPDNLLRFNMEITIRDVRNMKVPFTNTNNQFEDNFNSYVSKFIYVLHDCQFNFAKTKNFTADVRRGGFGSPSITASAGGTIEMNFKSYSKIMAPLLIDNNKIIDFRERETQSLNKDQKDRVYLTDALTNDYRSQTDITTIQKENDKSKNAQYKSRAFTNPDLRPGFGIQLPQLNTTGFFGKDGKIIKEIREIRNVIVKQVYTEVNQLITAGERLIGNKLGFTLGKTNVYYMSLEEKAVTRVAAMFEDLLHKESNVVHKGAKGLGRVSVNQDLNGEEKKDMQSAIWNQTKQDMKDTAEDRLRAYYDPRYSHTKPLDKENVYDVVSNNSELTSENVYENTEYVPNEKFPKGDVHPDGKYNQKFPEGDVHPDGAYNEKYPKGDLNSDGIYNQKFPEGDVHPDGVYNEKYPEGDVHPDGQYNEKFPEGDLNPDGVYNEKYPEGDLHPDGQYNQKFPSGDLHPDGVYNEKFPNGDLHPDGIYNQKFPDGDVHPDGIYNQKFPKGDLHPDGVYNEKYPEGDVHPDGVYNEKYPGGDLNPDGIYNQKFPKGRVGEKGSYNEKHPEGDVQPDGIYNEKYPKGSVEDKGKYNEKHPSGRIEERGTYNEKHPSGSVQPKGEYNEKHPSGVVQSEGKPNDKYPEGGLHPDGQYNQKFPRGSVEEKGSPNEKYPEGDLHSDGMYNQKFPEGSLEMEGTYHDKSPVGSVEEKGKYNDKPPVGNIYGKSKPLPPTRLTLGNVNKNKR